MFSGRFLLLLLLLLLLLVLLRMLLLRIGVKMELAHGQDGSLHFTLDDNHFGQLKFKHKPKEPKNGGMLIAMWPVSKREPVISFLPGPVR